MTDSERGAPSRLAAVGTAVAVALAAVAGCGQSSGGEPDGVRAAEPVTSAGASIEASASATPTGRPASLPDTYVVSTGTSLLVDDVGASAPRTLATYEPADSEDLPQHYLATVELSPDGTVAYADVCCEPAAGRVERVAVATGRADDRAVLSATDPAASPDGSRLAGFALDMLVVTGLDGGPGEGVVPPPASQELLSRTGLVWSPDSRVLALTEAPDDGEPGPGGSAHVRVLSPDTASSLDDGRVLTPPDGQTYAAPAFRGDGMLVVARQPVDDAPATAVGVVLDPANGAVVSEFPLDGRVVDQDYDRSGTFLLTTYADGHVGWQGAGQQGRLRSSGALSAAW